MQFMHEREGTTQNPYMFLARDSDYNQPKAWNTECLQISQRKKAEPTPNPTLSDHLLSLPPAEIYQINLFGIHWLESTHVFFPVEESM